MDKRRKEEIIDTLLPYHMQRVQREGVKRDCYIKIEVNDQQCDCMLQSKSSKPWDGTAFANAMGSFGNMSVER